MTRYLIQSQLEERTVGAGTNVLPLIDRNVFSGISSNLMPNKYQNRCYNYLGIQWAVEWQSSASRLPAPTQRTARPLLSAIQSDSYSVCHKSNHRVCAKTYTDIL